MAEQKVKVVQLDRQSQRWNHLKKQLQEFCDFFNVDFVFRVDPEDIGKCTKPNILGFDMFDLPGNHQRMSKINQECVKHNKNCVLLCDSFVPSAVKFSNLTIHGAPELLALSSSFDTDEPSLHAKEKLYNCFIHRVEPVRQSWFYFLYNNNLLSKGYVSFLLNDRDSDLTPNELFDKIHTCSLDTVDKFNDAYKNLKTTVPYRNFVDTNDLSEFINKSKYTLTLDTYAPDDGHFAMYISEKIVRSLEFPTVDLMFVQQGCINELANHGFAVDSQLLAIDNLNWRQRQQGILNILTQDTITTTIKEMHEQCMHNRSIFKNWFEKIHSINYYEKYINELC